MTILLSAIVSTYNAERFMRGCLEDLLAQTIADRMEIIVIDACSPQNEGSIVRELAMGHPNIVYIRTDARETLYESWNRAIRAARGTYLTSANTDDRHRSDGLQRLVEALESDPGAALAYADVAITLRENETFEQSAKLFAHRWPDYDRVALFRACTVGVQPVWRRALHDQYGGFDTSFVSAGDYEFWLRLAVNERFLHLPEVLGLYLDSPGSIEHRNPQLSWHESEKARLRYWSDQWGSRPAPRGFYLRPTFSELFSRLVRGDTRPIGDLARHVAMLLRVRFNRSRNRSQPANTINE